MTLVPGIAFVTGGGSGIGRAITEAFAAAGAPVAVMDLLPEGAAETLERIRSRGGRAELLRGDVGCWEDVDAAVTRAVETLGPLGVLVNAAGIIDGYTPAAEMTPALWERVILVNLTGTFFGCRRALAEMVPAGRGRIINVASVAGLVGSGGGPAYTASKHGVVGLTRQLAITSRHHRQRDLPRRGPDGAPGQLDADPGQRRARRHARRRRERRGRPADHARGASRHGGGGRRNRVLPRLRSRLVRDGAYPGRRRRLDRGLTHLRRLERADVRLRT